jgi:cation:H+ antiporter
LSTLLAVLVGFATVAVASLVITRGCDSFESASDFLGQNMPPGVKGATINAVGSSLPELFTTTILLFLFRDVDGYSGGIATCAGSAVFNAIIIPSLCIAGVVFIGVRQRGKRKRERVPAISIGKGTIIRDGFFLIVAELVLIYFLGTSTMLWWMGGVLMLVYLLYFIVLMRQFARHNANNGVSAAEAEEEDEPQVSFGRALWRFDFNQLFFGGRPFNKLRAWSVLGASIAVIGAGCYALSWAVVEVADALDVALYFTTVILAAAATSVPDTVLSVKDAMKGEYDDAVSNALGSNIFDITVALGLPLLVYGLVFGPVELAATGGASADVQILRIALLGITGAVMAIFLVGPRTGSVKAILMMTLYVLWTAFIIGRAARWPLVMSLTSG